MSRVVILGSSIAGVKAMQDILSKDKDFETTLISFDGHYPYNRDLFPQLLAKEVTIKQLFYKTQDFYEQNNIRVIVDKKLTRVNPKTKKVHTEDKEQIDFDILIITDAPDYKFLDIKGTNKAGVFGFRRLSDIDMVFKNLHFADTFAVGSDSFLGIQLASAIAKRGKEVCLVTSKRGIFSMIANEQAFEAIRKSLEEQKINVIRNEEITEVLGDTEAKAIRLKSGKVLSCEMILLGSQQPDWRVFSELPDSLKAPIDFKAQFGSQPGAVFVLDQACIAQDQVTYLDEFAPTDILEEQGAILASFMTGSATTVKREKYYRKATIGSVSFAWIGQLAQQATPEWAEFYDAEKQVYRIAFFTEGVCSGALLVNAAQDEALFARLIDQGANLAQIEEELKKQPKPQGAGELPLPIVSQEEPSSAPSSSPS